MNGVSSSTKGSVPRLAGPFAEFLAPFLSGGVLSLVRLLTGLLRVKYAALSMGAAGVGLISQGGQLQMLGITLGSLGIATGVASRILSAEREGEPERELSTLPTAFVTQLFCTVTLAAIGIIFRRELAAYVFGGAENEFRVVLVMVSIPLAVFSTGVMEGLLIGSGNFGLFVKASVGAALCSLVSFVVLAKFMGLDGAFLSYVVSSVFLVFLFFRQASRLPSLKSMLTFRFDWIEFKRLLTSSLAVLVTGLLGFAISLYVRSEAIRGYGAASSGILQAAMAFSAYYTPFLTNGLLGRLRVISGAHGNTAPVRSELFRNLRFVALGQAAIALIMLTMPDFLLRAAYSSEFLPAVPLLAIHVFGDSFFCLFFTFGIFLLGIGNLGAYVLGWLLYYGIQGAFVSVNIARYGVVTVPISHFVAAVIVVACSGAYLWMMERETGQRMTGLGRIGLCILAVGVQSSLVVFGGGLGWRLIVAVSFCSIALYVERSRFDGLFRTGLRRFAVSR